MYCPHCGNHISEKSDFCAACGRAVSENGSNKQKEKVGFILLAFAVLCICVVVFLIVCGLFGGLSENPFTNSLFGGSTMSSSIEKGYSEGTYKVGYDIPAGEYFIFCDTRWSCYFQVSSDSSGKLSSVVANDNITSFAFVSVKEGQYLTVTGGRFVSAAEASVPGIGKDGSYGEGMYRVGIDIPAGEYKVIALSGQSCYLEVSKDSTGSLFSIISNDNFSATAYITVEDGQYLTVKNGYFVAAK